MFNLSERIGFGCARLRGGFEENKSRKLVETALECGIRYFDTAPSYGVSERILGISLRGLRDEVEICTKVGLPREHGALRKGSLTAIAKVLAKSIMKKTQYGRDFVKRANDRITARSQVHYGDFDPGSVASSIQESMDYLQTDRLDCVLLHEPRQSDPHPDVAEVLQSLVASKRVLRVGVGTGLGPEVLPKFGQVAQFRIGPEVIHAERTRILVAHGLLRSFDPKVFSECAEHYGVWERLGASARRTPSETEVAALYVNAVLHGTSVDRILVSTDSGGRLRDLISEASKVAERFAAGDHVLQQVTLRGTLVGYFQRIIK